jgi:hypothetical protein
MFLASLCSTREMFGQRRNGDLILSRTKDQIMFKERPVFGKECGQLKNKGSGVRHGIEQRAVCSLVRLLMFGETHDLCYYRWLSMMESSLNSSPAARSNAATKSAIVSFFFSSSPIFTKIFP